MPTRTARRERGLRHAASIRTRLSGELRDARLAAGLSIDTVAKAAGMSAAQVRRVERDEVPGVSIPTLSILFSVVGLRLYARPYPEGPPLRDTPHIRLLARFRAELANPIRMRTEVPLRGDGDLRAYDARSELGSERCRLEAETALHDLQAVDRRVALKLADDGVERVILLVADTHRNRRALRESRDILRVRYPLDTRTILRALRAGRLPPDSGICIL